MALSVLFIGGTGQISLPCLHLALEAGHKISVLNRGKTTVDLPKGVETIVGDMSDEKTYSQLDKRSFDVIAQFRAYLPDQMKKDIAAFTGHAGQYVFISSASAYQKPAKHYIITERTPLANPYSQYSRDKIACETLLRDQTKLPYTIVRPSHTVRTNLPFPMGDGDALARRVLRGAPVIVPGDGTSLWALTRAADFAKPFVKLFGNPKALGEDFQITSDRSWTWNEIINAIAAGLGEKANIVHVPTDTLVAYHKPWEAPLTGDKIWSVLFDNSKVKSVAGPFTCSATLAEILTDSVMNFKKRNATASQAPHEQDGPMDRICAEQSTLGKD